MRKASRVLEYAVLGVLGLVGTEAQALCTFGGSGEPALQSTFDSLLSSPGVDAVNACVDDGSDGAWSTAGGTNSSVDIAIELAGNAASNEFGIYDLNDPSRRVTIFEGVDGAGSMADIRLRTDGTLWRVGVRENNGSPGDSSSWTWLLSLNTSAFGFYLLNSDQEQGPFFSQSALNAGHVDHMYAYQGNGSEFLTDVGGDILAGDVFVPTDYIVAWEDLNGGGDGDYQDFVAVLQDVTPVPVPAAVWLLISGLIGLAGVSRRST